MNQPTPNPSQEGSKTANACRQFPSWEGLGVGSGAQSSILGRGILSPSDGEKVVRLNTHAKKRETITP